MHLIKIQGVTSDFMHKVKSNFCLAYRVNCFEEQAENQCMASLNIKIVTFGGYRINRVRDNRDIKLNPTLVKVRDDLAFLKNQQFLPNFKER